MDLFELKDDVEVLFEIEGNKIVDYDIIPFDDEENGVKGFEITWTGSKGCGGFTYYNYGNKERLNTEFMGKEFCIKFMEEIFKRCEVEYDE